MCFVYLLLFPPADKMSLSGWVCLVTGASRGIGRGIALQLSEAGATVYITGRQERTLKQTAAQVTPTAWKSYMEKMYSTVGLLNQSKLCIRAVRATTVLTYLRRIPHEEWFAIISRLWSHWWPARGDVGLLWLRCGICHRCSLFCATHTKSGYQPVLFVTCYAQSWIIRSSQQHRTMWSTPADE